MGAREVSGKAVPIKIWGGPVEAAAAQQLQNVAALPFLFRHVAVMPDVHWGIGATVGTVVASRNTVIPAAVGVDIGCGVSAVRLPLHRDWLEAEERLPRIRRAIEQTVPVGFAQHAPPGRKGPPGPEGMIAAAADRWARSHLGPRCLKAPLGQDLLAKARLQLGTLGGGNHFIEICHDEEGQGWVLLHSGSRHIGKKIADFYLRRAKENLRRAGQLAALPDPNLAYLREGEPDFAAYLHDLFWAQHYARFNREQMMGAVLAEVAVLATGRRTAREVAALATERVDCHHNYVARETHFGQKVYVTRKGAVAAAQGQAGIIPGSMGAASYIVEGKGHPDSFASCAHGAGRAMSRTEAKRRFSVAELARQTEGVECRKDRGVLDEIPEAYKDIEAVMAQQAELVTVRHRLRQLVCVKG